ncbi:putative metalloprotease CJM1_0395 family protein [Desulfonatronum lacustre]|uniref:putative metalloprotease CJM1_0395 family protein n=1 Tax=Desulfonatronum lacustre TaxID=66849 RepID=UPI0004AE190A|nr:putative metalloprotease CJM1_0395 family protein [Desulfonatronum lacustre]
MVSLSHRTDQDSQRLKGDQGQAPALGLDMGYGPDARPVSAGVFEEQRHREPFTRKEGQGDAAPDQDDDPKEAHAADRNGSDMQDEINAVRDESELSSEDRQVLEQLRQRDAEVRAHEQAHVAAGGQYVTAGVSYTYETGPDGRQYAVGGEVSIDTSPVPGNPEQTEQKAQTIRRAALAPASPSPQDVKVATSAAQMEAEARMERIQNEQAERQADDGHPSPNLGQDQTASDHAGFFSRSPDSAFPTTFPPISETSPAHRAPSVQAYRTQLAMVETGNPF